MSNKSGAQSTSSRQRQEVEKTTAHTAALPPPTVISQNVNKSLITNSNAAPKIQLIKKLIQHDISLL